MALHPSAQRKPSFFRRLSASSESPPVVYASDQAILSGQPSYAPKNALRSTSGPSKRGLLAGPAYETLPFVIGQAGETTVQPTTSDRSRDRLLHNNGDAQPADRRGSSGIPKYLPSTSSEADVPIRLQASLSRSPPISAPPSASSPSAHPVLANNRQQRQPIHPALASPPNSPPRVRQEGSSHLTDSFQSIPTFPNSGVGSGQVRPSIVSLENVHPAPRDGRGRQASGPSSITLPASHVSPPLSTTLKVLKSNILPSTSPEGEVSSNMSPSMQLPLGQKLRSPSARGDVRASALTDLNRFQDAAESSLTLVTPLSLRPTSRPSSSAKRPTRPTGITGPSTPGTPKSILPVPHQSQSTNVTPLGITSQPPTSTPQPASYFPTNQLKSHEVNPEPFRGLSEAGAYAKSVAVTLSMSQPGPPAARKQSVSANRHVPTERRVSRPLPQPPAHGYLPTVQVNMASSRTTTLEKQQQSSAQSIEITKGLQKPSGTAGREKRNETDLIVRRVNGVRPLQGDRSPGSSPSHPSSATRMGETPATESRANNPIEEWARKVATPQHLTETAQKEVSRVPPQRFPATADDKQMPSSRRLTSMATETEQSGKIESLDRWRKKGKPTMQLLLSHTQIQGAILTHLSVNSFLSLTGVSEAMRKLFTGESVGRWVMGEWGIQLDRVRGRSWPNLTVWEGFLESLLHDPFTYSTYPAKWHNLLQHLSLSHTLIVLHLRNLPASAFVNSTPLPFEDEVGAQHLPFSASLASLSSSNLPRSRMSSTAGSDAGSIAPSSRMPRHERVVEITMPEPLTAQRKEELIDHPAQTASVGRKLRRRGSNGSISSGVFSPFGRKRSSTTTTHMEIDMSAAHFAAPMLSGKASLPPVSYPNAKRYGFTRHGDPTLVPGRSRTSSDSGRPGSVFSVQSSPSMSPHQRVAGSYGGRLSFANYAAPSSGRMVAIPPQITGNQRASVAGSDAGRSTRLSEYGGSSPIIGRWGFPSLPRRDISTRAEPAFDRPPPYIPGRAPIVRVFVPLSDRLPNWPSAEGARLAVKELDKCGATRRLKLGDLVVNTAIPSPKTTEHILLFVPYVKYLLVPLQYTHSSTGHLPYYVDAFAMAPSYYYPFLPPPQIIYLNLAPFAHQAMRSIRLAHDRRDVTVASGARLSAKRYLHVAGFEVKPGDNVAPEWQGMVSLEAEGTAEGKREIEKRIGGGDPTKAVIGPWEVVREKSMMGTVWLRLIREPSEHVAL